MAEQGSGERIAFSSSELAKVPAVTLGFWIIKVLATTLGETGGDTVSTTLNWGYLVGTAIFLGLLVILVWWPIKAKHFHPMLYWATIWEPLWAIGRRIREAEAISVQRQFLQRR
jgi:uncharacterized membrane-anchored protein